MSSRHLIFSSPKLDVVIGVLTGASLVLSGLFFSPSFLINHLGINDSATKSILQSLSHLRWGIVFMGVSLVAVTALGQKGARDIASLWNYFSRLEQRLESAYCQVLFCIACFAIAFILGWMATKSGTGIGPDSILYINSAKAILTNGISSVFTFVGFGPLYPLSIASLTYLGLDVDQAARLVPIFCFALLMFPIFLLGKTVRGVSSGYLACLVCLLFSPLLFVASHALGETLYILLSTLAVLFLIKFAESSEAKTVTLFFSGLFVTLAIATRFIGLSILVVGLIVIAIKNKSRLRKTAYQMLVFGSTSCFPLILWICQNTGFASNLGSYVAIKDPLSFFHNVFCAVRILAGDFYFCRYLNCPVYLIVVSTSITLIAVYVLARLVGVKALGTYLTKNYVVLLYTSIYFLVIIFMTSMVYTFGVQPRYLTPIYPFIILAAISFLSFVFEQGGSVVAKPAMLSIIIILFLIFFVFHGSNSVVYRPY